MLVAALRQRILELAIQGKLVPQRPEDGTADELYQQIQQEKKKLIAAGKLKKEKPLPPIKEEEILFDIPKSWKWVRFGDIVINRDSERIPLSTAQRSKLKKNYDYYGASGVIDKVEHYLFDAQLLLIGEDGANLLTRSKPIAFIAKGKYWVNNHAHVLDAGKYVSLEYLELFVNAISLVPYVTGSAQPKMNQARMNTIPVSLPPLAEQKRIVAKVGALFAELDAIEQSQERVAAIQAELNKRILERAIQGKLVPQCPAEGTAEDLYQQIQREKKKLIAAGKLKKEKPLRTITEEEIPFDIPESWKWVRLGECTTYGQAKQKATPDQIEDDTWCLELEDIEKDSARILQRLKVGERPIKGDRAVFKRGNVLFSKLRPYLHKILVADADGVCTTELVPFSCYNGILPEYMVLVLMSPCIDRRICGTSYGVKMPRVGTADMLSLPVPLPPTDEQKRIVDMVKICRC